MKVANMQDVLNAHAINSLLLLGLNGKRDYNMYYHLFFSQLDSRDDRLFEYGMNVF